MGLVARRIVGTVWPHLRAKVRRRRLKKATPTAPKKEAPGVKFDRVQFRALGTPGASLGHLWASWGRLSTSWGRLGVILGSSWVHFGGHLGVILWSSWGHLGVILGSFWGHLGLILGSSWNLKINEKPVVFIVFSRGRAYLGSSWDHFGTILGAKKEPRGFIVEASFGQALATKGLADKGGRRFWRSHVQSADHRFR